MYNLQLFAMTASNGSASHSSTWYSCKNSLPSLAPTSGRRQCPPLFFRHILWSQLPHQPHTTSHVSVMHIWPPVSLQPLAQLGLILCQLMSSTSCVERKFNRTLRRQNFIFHGILQPTPLRQEQGVSWELLHLTLSLQCYGCRQHLYWYLNRFFQIFSAYIYDLFLFRFHTPNWLRKSRPGNYDVSI